MAINKNNLVHIVHHVDTEGPLCEPLSELFKRIEFTFGLKLNLNPTETNLKKILNGMINLGSQDILKEIKSMASPHFRDFKKDWTEIDEMLKRIRSKKFRYKIVDSFGGGWIYNWHIMDHVGFISNERRRDIGYLNIFNHYEGIHNDSKSRNDEIHWHFHPIPFFRQAHIPATSYENSFYEIHQIICRRIIEKHWFPVVNRAGFHSERPDSNFFLEQWLPFDASNQSISDKNCSQIDNNFGRYGDWEGAPDDWSLYHPDFCDWRKIGNMNRVIARTLNLKTRFRNINKEEIEKAFLKAFENKENVYLGVVNHDFREMSTEIDDFRAMLVGVSKKFQNIKFIYNSTLNAFRSVLNYSENEVISNKIKFSVSLEKNVLRIIIKNGEIFGPQPYLAIKTLTGEYLHDNLDFGAFKKEYFYTFDRYTIELSKVETVAIASNDKYGNTTIWTKKIHH